MNIDWTCKFFNDLSPHELYSILQLRDAVFVVEQNCVYQDCDDKDQKCFHLCGWLNNNLVAYTRLMPPHLVYETPSIGRVVTSLSIRRTGVGRELMKLAIKKTKQLFGDQPITISAQFYLKDFYQSLGFSQTSDIYLEDGIDHIEMVYNTLQ